MSGQTLQKAFIPLPTGATAVYTSAGLAYYRHSDHLGSSRLATTPSRTLYSSTAYAPFGEPYAEAGSTDRSFTGKDEDTTSGMYDFLERRYNPTAGRWLSPDPAGLGAVDPTNPQTWNRYAYVMNNPLGLVDPIGEECYAFLGDGSCLNGYGGGGGGNLALLGGFADPFQVMQVPVVIGQLVAAPGTTFTNIYGTTYTVSDNNQWLGPNGEVVYDLGEPVLPDLTPVPIYGMLSWAVFADSGGSGGGPCGADCTAVANSMKKGAMAILQCAGQALKDNGISLAVDAAGFIPGEGAGKALFDIGLGIVGTVDSAMKRDASGAFMGIGGIHLAALEPLAKDAGWGIAKALPGLGTALNVFATGKDLYGAYKDYQSCVN